MRSVAVARCVCRSLPSVFHHLPFQVPYFVSHFFTYKPRLAYSYLYHHYLSPCCFFCRCVLLCVIQQCHCSSCARHSAPTVEVGSILYACTLSTIVMFVVVIGIWPMHIHTYLLLCVTGIFCSIPIPGSWIVYIRRVQYNQSVVASCTAAFVLKYLQQ